MTNSINHRGKNLSGSVPVILVVEDDDISRFLVVAILKNAGYIVATAINGKIAVDLFKELPIVSAVLMDIKMPVMDGVEAAAIIKSISPGTPIIAATAFAGFFNEDGFTMTGFDDFLFKPFDDKTILGKLSKFIDSKAFNNPDINE